MDNSFIFNIDNNIIIIDNSLIFNIDDIISLSSTVRSFLTLIILWTIRSLCVNGTKGWQSWGKSHHLTKLSGDLILNKGTSWGDLSTLMGQKNYIYKEFYHSLPEKGKWQYIRQYVARIASQFSHNHGCIYIYIYRDAPIVSVSVVSAIF